MLMHRHPAYLYLNMQEARDNFAQVIRIIETHPVFRGAVVMRYGQPVAILNALGRAADDGPVLMKLDAKHPRQKQEKSECAGNVRQHSTPACAETPTLPEIRARILGQIIAGPGRG